MEMTFGARLNDRRQSVTTLTPYYLKSNDRINLRIGARLDIASSGTVFHIAPDVRFDYTINNRASLAVSATGGNRMNPLHVIAERNRYVNPSMALIGNTYTLVDAEARLNIGLFKGLSLSPFVGFAVVRDAYVPEIGTVEPARRLEFLYARHASRHSALCAIRSKWRETGSGRCL